MKNTGVKLALFLSLFWYFAVANVSTVFYPNISTQKCPDDEMKTKYEGVALPWLSAGYQETVIDKSHYRPYRGIIIEWLTLYSKSNEMGRSNVGVLVI